MTFLEKFVGFAETLPAERRREVEEMLAAVMATLVDEGRFTPAELAELDRRMADPSPAYADPADIAALFARFR